MQTFCQNAKHQEFIVRYVHVDPPGADHHALYSTQAIARENAHTSGPLARMTRQTKVVSTSADMVDASRTLWWALHVPAIYNKSQDMFLSLLLSNPKCIIVGGGELGEDLVW